MEMGLMVKFFIVLVATLIGASTTLLFKMNPDNTVEQIAEEVIERETGVDIDLTP